MELVWGASRVERRAEGEEGQVRRIEVGIGRKYVIIVTMEAHLWEQRNGSRCRLL